MNNSIYYCCWNLPKKHIILLPLLIFILFGFLLLINFNIFYQNSFWYFSPKFDFEKRLPCLIRTEIHFQKAIELQNQGLAVLKHLNGKMNLKATWELIPRHFNEIWKNEFQNLDILRLQSDSEEMKYFIKFSNHFRRAIFSCHVVTLGVGHSIRAERNLSKIYPECHFLAVDPASEINANLIENKLNGTFIKAAIGGKTVGKSLTNVWGKDVERRGVQRRIMPQLGIFDFLRKYHTKNEPIDLLLIDIEGAEFGILEQFVNSSHFPIPICQINMEIHHPNELNHKYTYSRFFRNFDRLIRGRHFALFHTDIHDDSRYFFLRIFLINIADEICIRKFLC